MLEYPTIEQIKTLKQDLINNTKIKGKGWEFSSLKDGLNKFVLVYVESEQKLNLWFIKGSYTNLIDSIDYNILNKDIKEVVK